VNIETAIVEYNEAATDKEKQRCLRNIREALGTVESLQQDRETYAGFCRYYFKNDDIYQKAKKLIAA
jgi:arginyl-tRNA--protein-N-Asp/Glu arginylyltransferase